ncbi:MAG TPA: hypothetical protein VF698_15065 [Thermoanaerobaculia bacterium]
MTVLVPSMRGGGAVENLGTAQFVVADVGTARIEPSGTPFDAPGDIFIVLPFEQFFDRDAFRDPEVTFGSDRPVLARVERRLGSSVLVVRPRPQTAAAVVDVKVRGESGAEVVLRNAFTFYDPAAGPDERVFERILLPIVFNGPGAFGTQWRTDVILHRRDAGVSPWSIPLTSFRPIHSRPFDGDRVEADLISERPRGFVYHVARTSADRVQFAVTVRETSRGVVAARVPAVRESDFRSRMTLVEVPVGPRYRSKLRVYSYTPIFWVGVLLSDLRGSRYFQLPLTARASADEPYYAEADLAALAEALLGRPTDDSGTIRLELWPAYPETPRRIWSCVTVTDNDTQAVTFISGE